MTPLEALVTSGKIKAGDSALIQGNRGDFVGFPEAG
ncbi:hypothetical protein EPIR_0526 [Erwinia piriflorinigrans CFBP 5888]|uniref:Uncharacterized protein n=1 Tax=Erwinia piriflorinigrans CFBP 5888 TaxID=1161919 RepID=V5Z4P1_9GAMM|nr:hypothetical protein EPIR_0526 [Erwinia piriflorinigrans CFBP 5888]